MCTLSRAVSIQWNFLYADCNKGYDENCSMWLWIWDSTLSQFWNELKISDRSYILKRVVITRFHADRRNKWILPFRWKITWRQRRWHVEAHLDSSQPSMQTWGRVDSFPQPTFVQAEWHLREIAVGNRVIWSPQLQESTGNLLGSFGSSSLRILWILSKKNRPMSLASKLLETVQPKRS